jgi:hypothetical protein
VEIWWWWVVDYLEITLVEYERRRNIPGAQDESRLEPLLLLLSPLRHVKVAWGWGLVDVEDSKVGSLVVVVVAVRCCGSDGGRTG